MRSGLVFLSLLFVLGCSNDSMIEESVTSSPYFPLKKGNVRDYQVEELIFLQEGSRIDTQSYLLREEIVDTRINAEGEMEYIIDISKRQSQEQSWNYLRSERKYIDDNRAIRIEGNLPIVKLRFPIATETTWDATALFDEEVEVTIGGQQIQYYQNWNPRYLAINGSESMGDNVFENVTTVEVANSVNRLELRQVTEKYAPDVGLIYRELSILDTQCFENCESVAWKDKADKGHIVTQQLIGYN